MERALGVADTTPLEKGRHPRSMAVPLAGTLLLALASRLIGLSFGLPHTQARPDETDIIVVAHFGPIVAALQRAEGLSPEAAFAHRIDTLSVTSLSLAPPQVFSLNHRP